MAYRASFLAAEEEFAAAGGDRIFDRHAALLGDFTRYVAEVAADQGRQPRERDRVPATVLWLLDGDTYVGRVNLRHRLNAVLERIGGHVGYEIRPSLRCRGYATKALALGLDRAAALGLRRVLLVCAEDNIGSRRVIEANGGLPHDLTAQPERAEPLCRYWIDLEGR